MKIDIEIKTNIVDRYDIVLAILEIKNDNIQVDYLENDYGIDEVIEVSKTIITFLEYLKASKIFNYESKT